MSLVDLFAGPGGFDIAAQQLGVNPIGIEWDRDACATRRAAGLTTIRADLDSYQLPPGPLEGLIGSPPCPAFSISGLGDGRADIPALVSLIDNDRITDHDAPSGMMIDSRLLMRPVQWIDRHRPRWVALEQVPPVLPVWQAMARWLERRGYRAWAGVLCAADFGVPQVRKRAFLLAHADRPVSPPMPTHAEFPQPDLFGGCLEEWVSMGEALGLDAGGELDQYENGYRPARSVGEPAPTITTKSDRWEWKLDPRERRKPLRSLDCPAETLTGSAVNNWVFRRPATTVQGDSRIWPPGHKINQADIDRLGAEEARLRYGCRGNSDAVKVEPWQAAVLQSFPTDYPFQGSKSSQAKQIGNAVPPLLAWHVLSGLVD